MEIRLPADGLGIPLRAPTTSEIRLAAESIRGRCIRTPLVRLNWSSGGGDAGAGEDPSEPEIYLKLECLQPVKSFKCRPAANALATILRGGRDAKAALQRSGVCTASAGNFGQGLAWVCREQGILCTILAPDHAPTTKLDAMRRRGAHVITVPFDDWWRAIETHGFPQAPAGARFIHPGCDNAVLCGNATIALEIAEDLPTVDLIIAPYGSGALVTGIACGVRALVEEGLLSPGARVLAAEPEPAAPFAASMRAGCAQRLGPKEHASSFVDGCGGKAVLEELWPLARRVIDGGVGVPLDAIASAIRTIAERNSVVAEGAGACPVAAAMLRTHPLCAAAKRIVCVVSGGGIDEAKLAYILRGRGVPPAGALLGTGAEEEYSMSQQPVFGMVQTHTTSTATGRKTMPPRMRKRSCSV